MKVRSYMVKSWATVAEENKNKGEAAEELVGAARECFSSMADWLMQMLEAKYKPSMDN